MAIAHNPTRVGICTFDALTTLVEWLQFLVGPSKNITLTLLSRYVAILVICLDHPLLKASVPRVIFGCQHARLFGVRSAEHVSLWAV